MLIKFNQKSNSFISFKMHVFQYHHVLGTGCTTLIVVNRIVNCGLTPVELCINIPLCSQEEEEEKREKGSQGSQGSQVSGSCSSSPEVSLNY